MRTRTRLVGGSFLGLLTLSLPASAGAQSCQSALGSLPALKDLDLAWSADGRSATFGAAAIHVAPFGGCRYAAITAGPLSLGDVTIDSVLVVVATTAGNPPGSSYPAASQSRRAGVLATRSSVSFALSEGVNVFGVLNPKAGSPAADVLGAMLGSGLIAVSGSGNADVMGALSGGGDARPTLDLTLTGSSGQVSAAYDAGSGAASDAMLSLGGSLPLSEIPGLSRIPHAGDATLTGVALSEDAVTGRGTVAGDSVSVSVFKADGDWVVAANIKDLTLSAAVGAGGVALLAGVEITDGALVMSEDGLIAHVSGLPAAVRPLFASAPGGSVDLGGGIGVIVAVEASASGALGKSLATLGVGEEKTVFMGTAPGAIGGSGGFDLRMPLETVAEELLAKVPAFVKLPSDVSPALFLKAGSNDAELGISISVDSLPVVLGKDTLAFDAMLTITASASDPEVGVTGSLDRTWQKPFGIGGLALDSATLTVDMDPETSAATVKVGGTATVGAERVTLAATVTATGGVADAAAFEGHVDRLTLTDVVGLANAAILAADPRAAAIRATSLPDVALRSVDLAFASPGSKAPSVGLQGAGTRLKADVYVSGGEAGNFLIDVDDAGFRASGAAAGLSSLGALSISDPWLDISATKGQSLDVALGGKVTILGVTDSIAASIGPDSVHFDMESEFGGLWKTTLGVRATGASGNATVNVSGDFDASGFSTWLSTGIGKGIPDVTSALVTTVADSLVAAVDGAVAALDTARAAAEAALHKALQELDAAQSALSTAQSDLSSCEGEVRHYRHLRDGTSWTDPGKKARYEGEMLEWEGTCGARRAIVSTAQASVDAIEAGTDVFVSVGMQPAVVAKRVLLGTAKGILEADSFAVNVSKKVQASLDSLLRDVGGQLKVNRAGFRDASLSAITGSQPVDLELDVTLGGVDFVGSVDFTLGGAANAVLDSLPAKLAHGMGFALRTQFEDTTATPGIGKGVAVVDFEPKGRMLRSVTDATSRHLCMGTKNIEVGTSVELGTCGSGDLPHQTWDIIKTDHGGSGYRTGMICAAGGAVSGPCIQYDVSTTSLVLQPSNESAPQQQWNVVHDGNTFFLAAVTKWKPGDFSNSQCLSVNNSDWTLAFWPPCVHDSWFTWYVLEPSGGG